MAANEKRTVMARMFEQKMKPTLFLASHATPQTTLASSIEIDIVRGLETFAVDIVPGAGGRGNKKTRYTTKEYTPPMYNEFYNITAEELMKRLPGQTKYDAADSAFQATLLAIITDKQAMMQDKELRSIELQARDAMFDGTITLHNGDVIDFKKKTTHTISPTYKWNASTGVPLTDLEAACALCRKDGKIGASRFKLVVADDVVEALIANAQFIAKANIRHIENVQMGMPTDINADGATFHGVFSAGSYTIELWAYPQFYTVPVGFGLANEGTMQPYIPSGKALLLPATGLRMDLWYAGIPQVVNQVDSVLAGMGLTGTIGMVEADFVPYARLDDRSESIEAGVKTRPLFVPHQIDGLCSFDTLV